MTDRLQIRAVYNIFIRLKILIVLRYKEIKNMHDQGYPYICFIGFLLFKYLLNNKVKVTFM